MRLVRGIPADVSTPCQKLPRVDNHHAQVEAFGKAGIGPQRTEITGSRSKIMGADAVTISKAKTIAVAIMAAGAFVAAGAHAQEVKHYRFAHDQQIPSGYSVAY